MISSLNYQRLVYRYGRCLVLILIACTLGCRASQILFPEIDPGDENWLTRESAHFYIHCRPNSEAEEDMEEIAAYLDQKFTQICEILDVEYENKISYFIYSSAEDLKKNVSQETWGFAVGEYEAIGYFYPTMRQYDSRLGGLGHEVVHIIVYWTMGVRELHFLDEGIADAIDKYSLQWSRPPVLWAHWRAALVMKRGNLLSISQLSDNKFFRDLRYNRELYHTYYLYDQCGSFVRYLIDRYGIEKFKRFFPAAKEDSYQAAFQNVYGLSIHDFEEDWHEFLQDYLTSGPSNPSTSEVWHP
ncbi:MAG: hypothetical protein JSV10_10220 [Candidatus Zixiibacteriota bacterium]|nr:MAG: hypothetical protein JSV10_10220 [candidate division Zixibacteria bacterium]